MRAAWRRRCWGSDMAAAVRAAGCLPALCGAPVGENGNAELGLRVGWGPLPGGEKREAARGPWGPDAGLRPVLSAV